MSQRDRQQVIGETVLWTLTVALLGLGAFGWAGTAFGVAFAMVHVVMRRRESTTPRVGLVGWHLLVLPSLLGITLAAVPLPLWVFLAPVLLVLWLGTPLPTRVRPLGRRMPARLAGLLVIAAAICLCAVFPKHLDRKVGPARYSQVGVGELCARLREDHDIACKVHVGVSQGNVPIDFEIPHPMPRRNVAAQAGD